MAVNLEAIRKKIESLKSIKNSRVQFWKPELGLYTIRIVPFKDADEDDPFKRLTFYYLEEGKAGVLAPYQFNKPDPVQELSRQLWKGTQDEKALAKKLRPNTRYYANIIDRENEDMGPQLWSFSKTVYNRLLEFFADDEVLDYIDPETGYDLKVKITKEGGKQFNTITVDVARKQSKLSTDKKLCEEWLANPLEPLDAYTEKTAEEIEKYLSDWLKEGTEEDDVGMEKGVSTSKTLDDAINSLQKSSSDDDTVSKKKSSKSKKVDVESDNTSVDIDKVFEEALKM